MNWYWKASIEFRALDVIKRDLIIKRRTEFTVTIKHWATDVTKRTSSVSPQLLKTTRTILINALGHNQITQRRTWETIFPLQNLTWTPKTWRKIKPWLLETR